MTLLSLAYLQASSQAGGELMSTLILVVPMVLIFYFFIIKPQGDARKKHMAMVEGVRRGDRVVTGGGIVGKVVKVPENSDEVTVELADGVQVQVMKASLSDVRSKTQPADSGETDSKSDKK